MNRLSLGVQSFDDRFLRALGRVHDADEARRAAESALMIFGNVNFDLMYALPGQTVDDARRDVAAALSFAPPHLSFYHLTLEPNTLFHRYPPPLPDDEAAADIEDAVLDMLADAGYAHYETSAHAKAGPSAATTSTTGASAITSASAPARIRSCRSPIASCGRCAGSSRANTSSRSRAARRCRRRRTSRAATCRSSSC